MKSITSKFIALAFAAASIVTSGCHTTGTSDSGSKPAVAAGCEKCKTVWVQTRIPGKFQGYSMTNRMSCPDCVSAVENLIKTGEAKHTCATCGGTIRHCTTH